MSKAKYTPGPWEHAATFPPGDFVIYSKTAKGRVESECKRVAYVYTENEDDARLIAAALDMLAALREIEGAPASMVNDAESLRHTIKTIQHVARAAIAKADGLT